MPFENKKQEKDNSEKSLKRKIDPCYGCDVYWSKCDSIVINQKHVLEEGCDIFLTPDEALKLISILKEFVADAKNRR